MVGAGRKYPPPNNARVELDIEACFLLATVRSPKSCASPVVAMVMYSIVLTLVGLPPPPSIPLVAYAAPRIPFPCVGEDISPKIFAFPSYARVT